jgi:hypothetical protein
MDSAPAGLSRKRTFKCSIFLTAELPIGIDGPLIARRGAVPLIPLAIHTSRRDLRSGMIRLVGCFLENGGSAGRILRLNLERRYHRAGERRSSEPISEKILRIAGHELLRDSQTSFESAHRSELHVAIHEREGIRERRTRGTGQKDDQGRESGSHDQKPRVPSGKSCAHRAVPFAPCSSFAGSPKVIRLRRPALPRGKMTRRDLHITSGTGQLHTIAGFHG